MDSGRDLDPWQRPRPGSRWDELRGGRRAEKPGQGPGPTGRSCGNAPGWGKAAPGPEDGGCQRAGVAGVGGCA